MNCPNYVYLVAPKPIFHRVVSQVFEDIKSSISDVPTTNKNVSITWGCLTCVILIFNERNIRNQVFSPNPTSMTQYQQPGHHPPPTASHFHCHHKSCMIPMCMCYTPLKGSHYCSLFCLSFCSGSLFLYSSVSVSLFCPHSKVALAPHNKSLVWVLVYGEISVVLLGPNPPRYFQHSNHNG